MILKFLRKKKTMKRIIWGLAILIIPAFVVWGAGSSKKTNGPDYAGKVFNKKVSFDEYADMWRVSRDYLTQQFGAGVPPAVIDGTAWSRIILLESAKRARVSIKDPELFERIASFPVFQKNGYFDKETYKALLGKTVKGFEERIRDDMLIEKFREKITKKVALSDKEVKDIYQKKYEKVKASFVTIPFADFKKDVEFQEREIESYYEKNKNAFTAPEHRNVRYIEISFADFKSQVNIEESSIRRYFEDHISDYKKSDSEKLPKLNKDIKNQITQDLSLKEQVSLAEETSYKVLDLVAEKANLDDAAKSFALEVKETGFFNMQEPIPDIGWSFEFTKKTFESKPNEISNALIKTEGGFYIIQLKEIKKSHVPAFDQIKNTVIGVFIKDTSIKLASKKAQKLYANMNNHIRNSMTFEEVTDQLGLELKQTDFISREDYIPYIGPGPAKDVLEACILLKNGTISKPIKTPESWVILRLDEYQSIDEAKFIEEKDDFKRTLLEEKKQAAFNRWFEKTKKESNFVSYVSQKP